MTLFAPFTGPAMRNAAAKRLTPLAVLSAAPVPVMDVGPVVLRFT